MGLKRTRVARRVFVVGVGVVAAAPPNHSMVCSRGALRGCSSRPCYGRRGCGTATCERSRARAAGGQTMLWFARGPGGGKFALEQTIVWFVPARRGPCNMQARPRRAGRAPAAQAVPHRKARAPLPEETQPPPRAAPPEHGMFCSRGPAEAKPWQSRGTPWPQRTIVWFARGAPRRQIHGAPWLRQTIVWIACGDGPPPNRRAARPQP